MTEFNFESLKCNICIISNYDRYKKELIISPNESSLKNRTKALLLLVLDRTARAHQVQRDIAQ